MKTAVHFSSLCIGMCLAVLACAPTPLDSPASSFSIEIIVLGAEGYAATTKSLFWDDGVASIEITVTNAIPTIVGGGFLSRNAEYGYWQGSIELSELGALGFDMVARNASSTILYTGHTDEVLSSEDQPVYIAAAAASAHEMDITSFSFSAPEATGTLDDDEATVLVMVPVGTDVTALVPIIVHNGASISPASGIARDFTDSVTYTVSAEDGSTRTWTVTVREPKANIELFLTNMPMPDGNYSLIGDFRSNAWDSSVRSFPVSGGAGYLPASSANLTENSYFTFSIVEAGTYNRLFYPATRGNLDSFGDLHNFAVTVPLNGGNCSISVDGSKTFARVDVDLVTQVPGHDGIDAFSFDGVTAGSVDIDHGAGTIDILLPAGTGASSLVPLVTHTGASLNPASGVVQDFSSPVTYTVTSADAETWDYIVTVVVQDPAPPALAIIGDAAGGWETEKFTLRKDGESTFIGLTWLEAGSFILREPGGLGDSYFSASNEGSLHTLSSGSGADFTVSSAAFHLIRVDFTAYTLDLVPVSSLGVIGDATAGGWSSDMDLTGNASTDVFQATLSFSTGTWKFRMNHVWTYNWGDSDVDGYADFNGNNIISSGAGDVIVTFHGRDMAYSVVDAP